MLADIRIKQWNKYAKGQGYHGAQKCGADNVIVKFVPHLCVHEGGLELNACCNGKGNQVDDQHKQKVKPHFIQDFLPKGIVFKKLAEP